MHGPLGSVIGSPEHRHAAGDVVQPAHEVALARDGDDGPRPPLADDAARELPARGDEGRDAVALRDLEHAVERLAGEAARDEDEELARALTRRSRASASRSYTTTLAWSVQSRFTPNSSPTRHARCSVRSSSPRSASRSGRSARPVIEGEREQREPRKRERDEGDDCYVEGDWKPSRDEREARRQQVHGHRGEQRDEKNARRR